MNAEIRVARRLQLALVVGGLALIGGVMAAEPLTEVTVQAPRASKIVGHSDTGTGAPIELVTLSRHVSYSDLDLVSHAAAVELEKRVNDTAAALCKQLDTLYPLSKDTRPNCAKQASDDAMPQVRSAVAAAEKRAGSK
jgi:UrcA family protein